jgi:hypothetical protein
MDATQKTKCELLGCKIHHARECVHIWYFGAHLADYSDGALAVRHAQLWDANQVEPLAMVRAEQARRVEARS